MRDLGQNVKITHALDYANGRTDREGAILDMAHWTGVLILVAFAAIATGAAVKIKVQQGAAADLSDAADLEGTDITVPDNADNQDFWIDVKPTERYVRVVVDNDATNDSAQSAVYVQYGPHGVALPISDAKGETHFEPAEVAAG